MEVQEHAADLQQQDSQDWEWVEETEYIVLDFGGSNIDASDMDQLTTNGYSIIVRKKYCTVLLSNLPL
jgi:molecular chaperone DnaK (HSP70)